ncbi:MAG: hypothetical protein PHW04_13945 [Candidatus Wallbacteria bacterium]|nr:hypothetical protein [Candidatus Wallbacteria bacterium]
MRLTVCALLLFSLAASAAVYDGWLYPGQDYNFPVQPGMRINYVEVTWSDNGGNAVGMLYLGSQSCGARNVASAAMGVKERWYVSTTPANLTAGTIKVYNDTVKIFGVYVDYGYQPVLNQPANPGYPSNYFNNTGNYYPKAYQPAPRSLDQVITDANDEYNDRYNWPGWYEPGRDYRFQLEPKKKIRQIRIRWYCTEGKAYAWLYINWRMEGTRYVPKGNYPFYDWWYLFNATTDDGYFNEGRLSIYYEKVYIDSVDVEYDNSYNPANPKGNEPVKVIFESISK